MRLGTHLAKLTLDDWNLLEDLLELQDALPDAVHSTWTAPALAVLERLCEVGLVEEYFHGKPHCTRAFRLKTATHIALSALRLAFPQPR